MEQDPVRYTASYFISWNYKTSLFPSLGCLGLRFTQDHRHYKLQPVLENLLEFYSVASADFISPITLINMRINIISCVALAATVSGAVSSVRERIAKAHSISNRPRYHLATDRRED